MIYNIKLYIVFNIYYTLCNIYYNAEKKVECGEIANNTDNIMSHLWSRKVTSKGSVAIF